jgi:hypothetical protein
MPTVVPEGERSLTPLLPAVPLPVEGVARVNTFVSPYSPLPHGAARRNLVPFATAEAPNVGLILVPDAAALLFFVGGAWLAVHRRVVRRRAS